MQTLYSVEAGAISQDVQQASRILKDKLKDCSDLFLYLLHLISEVAQYAEKDAANRSGKHLPTEADLSVNTKISENRILDQLHQLPGYRKALRDGRFGEFLPMTLVQQLYQELTGSQEYLEYISHVDRQANNEKSILSHLFNEIILPSEDVDAHLSEVFLNWDDDAAMMQNMVTNYISKPASWELEKIISEEKQQFAHKLLETAIEKKDYCLETIRPKLKNWEADRIAQLDMILMRMGLCELLFFETIPAKVTINEYIDLAKEYSTAQSGQFVNGILDSIHKDLEQKGILKKVEFRK